MQLLKGDSKPYHDALDLADEFQEKVVEVVGEIEIPTMRIDLGMFIFKYGDVVTHSITIHDTEVDHKTRLSNLFTIGRLFGVSKWKREFDQSAGNFHYSATIPFFEFELTLVHNNASQGQCTIIKKTEMVERVTYEADCGKQADAELAVTPEGMIE